MSGEAVDRLGQVGESEGLKRVAELGCTGVYGVVIALLS